MHAGIPGTNFDSRTIKNSALQALVGSVVGGAVSLIGALISLIMGILKLKDTCRLRGTSNQLFMHNIYIYLLL